MIISSANCLEVCFNDNGVGCFDSSEMPGNNNLLPATPEQIGTKFVLFTVAGPSRGTSITGDKESMERIVPRNNVVFVVHGWTADYNDRMKLLVNTLLRVVPQVIFVDWSKGAAVYYDQAVANAQLVARQMAYLINRMRVIRNVDMSNVHIVGHSLGAQIAGLTGRRLIVDKNVTLGRISGMFQFSHRQNDFKNGQLINLISTGRGIAIV